MGRESGGAGWTGLAEPQDHWGRNLGQGGSGGGRQWSQGRARGSVPAQTKWEGREASWGGVWGQLPLAEHSHAGPCAWSGDLAELCLGPLATGNLTLASTHIYSHTHIHLLTFVCSSTHIYSHSYACLYTLAHTHAQPHTYSHSFTFTHLLTLMCSPLLTRLHSCSPTYM